jgi:hypothetical protein
MVYLILQGKMSVSYRYIWVVMVLLCSREWASAQCPELELTLVPIPPMCERSQETTVLLATPAGGTWSGPGVSGNIFRPSQLTTGAYTLKYTYTSPLDCTYEETMTVDVMQYFTPAIGRLSGNLCEEGLVTLQVLGPVPPSAAFTWEYKPTATGTFAPLAEGGITLETDQHGFYRVWSLNVVCYAVSTAFAIEDTFTAAIIPDEPEHEVCDGEAFTFSFQHEPGTGYAWYYADALGTGASLLPGQDAALTITETGYYYAQLTRGVCLLETEPSFVKVYPRDSVFMPNVFTPNGDDWNEVFRAMGNVEAATLKIINRTGDTVFSGDAAMGWRGNGAASGIYFWSVSYKACRGEDRILKGQVHLIR